MDEPSNSRDRRRPARHGRLWGILLQVIFAGTTAAAESPSDLAAHVDAARGGAFTPTSTVEWDLAKALFGEALTGAGPDALDPRLQALGLVAETLDAEGGPLLVIRERKDDRRGRGMFAIRGPGHGRTVLQIPHSRSDRDTGRIGAAWMQTLPFRAAAFNSVHRNQLEDTADTSDLARAPLSYFTALTAAAMERLPDPRVLQIHGFDARRRRTRAGRSAWAVVSSGVESPEPPALEIAACLDTHLEAVRIYGLDVDELGGTVNPVGRRMRGAGFTGYVHIEFSADVRTRITNDQAWSEALGACLLGPGARGLP